MIKKEKNGVVWYEFEHMAKTGLVNHCFSTRIGGISKAPYDTMNLAYHMGDEKEAVNENFKRISAAVGFDSEKMAMTKQIHKAEVQTLSIDDQVDSGMDGLITTAAGLTLVSYYADCVPLLFLDPTKGVVANTHAGWRGTSLNIAQSTVDKMVSEFGSQREDILVGIGPCISMDCFEVGAEVVDIFKRNLPQLGSHIKKKNSEKWHFDLTAMNRQLLMEAGILPKNIEVANLCTFSDPEHFFSHRRDNTARGNMVAMIALN